MKAPLTPLSRSEEEWEALRTVMFKLNAHLMCVRNFGQLHLRDPSPVQPAVSLPGRFFVITDQNDPIRMLDVDRDLLVPIAGELVNARLRHFREFLKRHGVTNILQASANPAAVVGSVVPNKLSFGIQHLRQLVISKGQFHKTTPLSTNHSSQG